MKNFIPFNKPCLQGKELIYVKEAIKKMHISGDGEFTKKCNTILENSLDIKKALITTSCTHALEISALLLNIQKGDEVIIPSFTFVSTVNAFILQGAKPVFIDIRRDTLNLDENQLENLITEKTKAIVPVHYAGVGCEMDNIIMTAKKHGIEVIEDNAHGLFGKYKNKQLGTMSGLSTLSFHETKNYTCGEGGALLINDERYLKRAEIIREKGTNRSEFFRGAIDKYTWVDLGSSYLPSDILAGFLYAQLEQHNEIKSKRKKIWDYYFNNLNIWARENDISLPYIPSHCDQAYHMFYILLPSLKDRTNFIKEMEKKGIGCVFHYIPLHSTPMAKQNGWDNKNCPVSDEISDRIVRLPFYNDLFPDIDTVIDKIKEFEI